METNLELVEQLKSSGTLYDESVERAMLNVDRMMFVEEANRGHAYEDRPLPTKLGQTMSAPHMVAIMSQYLRVSPGMKILEIGAGSGYQAAILGELAGPDGEVFTVERVPEIAGIAKKRLFAYSNIEVHTGNGINGLRQKAPFDRILVTAAAQGMPPGLVDQLSEGGKMVIPIAHGAAQRLILVEKFAGQTRKTDLDLNCIFVPLIP